MNSKKLLALLLSALMLTSTFVACDSDKGKETDAVETDAPETGAPIIEYDESLVTRDGVATAHIVVADGADALLTYAAEELTYHIQKVSGAEVSITNTTVNGSLPIIIATPDTCPELNDLFADDIAWLSTLEEDGKRYGSDGFAIRQIDKKLYIFGMTPRGALNGVYDFIEENMGILWIRANEDIGLIYEEQSTVTITKTDYREKSPFELRGWTLAVDSDANRIRMARNKLNVSAVVASYDNTDVFASFGDVGIEPFVSNHNIKWWITTSPSYDPSCTEYWSTNEVGEHMTSAEASTQVNYWSDVTVQCIADSVIAFLDRHKEGADIDYVGINLEDTQWVKVYPEMTEPYEYSPGKFTTPDDENYISTVFFGFINKIAAKVAEKHPDVKITSYSYAEVEAPPKSDIELCDNVYITYCSYNEDMLADIDNPSISLAYLDYQHQMDWMAITSNIQVYAYYGCVVASPLYERACWDRIQSDLQLYAANGINGMVTEGVGDGTGEAWVGWTERTETRAPYYTHGNTYTMNTLTNWLYEKLCWNPDEDIDALIDYYCEKVYGEAAPYMREYYRLLELGWKEGADDVLSDFQNHMKFNRAVMDYWDFFLDVEVDGVCIYDAICEALNSAWEVADEQQRKLMGHIKNVYDNAETLFLG